MRVVQRSASVLSYIESVPVLQVSLGILVCSVIQGWGAILSVVLFTLVRSRFRVQQMMKWLGLLAGVLFMGVRMFLMQSGIPAGGISAMNGENVAVRGIVTGDYVLKEDRTSVVLRVKTVCESLSSDSGCERWSQSSGLVQTWFPRFPAIREGDLVEISGRIEAPPDDVDEQDGGFSYRVYLESKDVYSVMYRPVITYLGERDVSFVKEMVVVIRYILLNKINGSLPEPHAALLSGILLGVRQDMPEEFSNSLQETGTTHIIAASGYNVSLVANVALSLFSFLHRKLRIVASMGAIWLFVLISGASLPVVRAGLMGTFALIALLEGGQSLVHVSLPFSGALMVLVDPEVVSSASFQLSFCSTAGLVYLVPVLEGYLEKYVGFLGESTFVTLSAIIATIPITIYHFGRISMVAPMVNFFVLPVVEYVMLAGVVLLVLPQAAGVIYSICIGVVWAPLEYFITVVVWFSKIPFASVSVGSVPAWAVALAYAVIVCIILERYPVGISKLVGTGMIGGGVTGIEVGTGRISRGEMRTEVGRDLSVGKGRTGTVGTGAETDARMGGRTDATIEGRTGKRAEARIGARGKTNCGTMMRTGRNDCTQSGSGEEKVSV